METPCRMSVEPQPTPEQKSRLQATRDEIKSRDRMTTLKNSFPALKRQLEVCRESKPAVNISPGDLHKVQWYKDLVQNVEDKIQKGEQRVQEVQRQWEATKKKHEGSLHHLRSCLANAESRVDIQKVKKTKEELRLESHIKAVIEEFRSLDPNYEVEIAFPGFKDLDLDLKTKLEDTPTPPTISPPPTAPAPPADKPPVKKKTIKKVTIQEPPPEPIVLQETIDTSDNEEEEEDEEKEQQAVEQPRVSQKYSRLPSQLQNILDDFMKANNNDHRILEQIQEERPDLVFHPQLQTSQPKILMTTKRGVKAIASR